MLVALSPRHAVSTIAEQRSELAHNVSKIVGRLAHAGADLQSTALDAVSDGKATNNEIRDTEARASALIGAAEDTLRAVASLRAV